MGGLSIRRFWAKQQQGDGGSKYGGYRKATDSKKLHSLASYYNGALGLPSAQPTRAWLPGKVVDETRSRNETRSMRTQGDERIER